MHFKYVSCMVRDEPKLPVPKLNGVVGGSIHGREIVCLLDGTSQVVECLMCFIKEKKTKRKVRFLHV